MKWANVLDDDNVETTYNMILMCNNLTPQGYRPAPLFLLDLGRKSNGPIQ